MEQYAKTLYQYFQENKEYPEQWDLKECIENYECTKADSFSDYQRIQDITNIPDSLCKEDENEFNCDVDLLVEEMNKTAYWNY